MQVHVELGELAKRPTPTPSQQEAVFLLLRRGGLRARTGQWRAAADDYIWAIKLDPQVHSGWYELAAVRLQLGDLDEYRRHCREMLRRFEGTTNPYEAERTAKACLIVPNTLADQERPVRLIEQALTCSEKEWGYPWFLLSRGMAECRAGRPQSAIEWIHKGRQKIKDAPPVYEALGSLFLALAYHQLKEGNKARAALATATRLLDENLPKADSGDLGSSWLDGVFCRVVRREVEGLVSEAIPAPRE